MYILFYFDFVVNITANMTFNKNSITFCFHNIISINMRYTLKKSSLESRFRNLCEKKTNEYLLLSEM